MCCYLWKLHEEVKKSRIHVLRMTSSFSPLKPPKTVDFQQFREVSFYILNNNILLIIIYRYFCAFFTHYCILSGYLKLLFIREIIKSITPRLNHTFRWGFNKAIESVNIIICWCGKSYCSYCPKNCINYIMDWWY